MGSTTGRTNWHGYRTIAWAGLALLANCDA
jgi:hypothetical protein